MKTKQAYQCREANPDILQSQKADELILNFSKLSPDEMVYFASKCADIVNEFASIMSKRNSFIVDTSYLPVCPLHLLNSIKIITIVNYLGGNLKMVDECKNLYLSVAFGLGFGRNHQGLATDMENKFLHTHNAGSSNIKDCHNKYLLEFIEALEINKKILERDFNAFMQVLSTMDKFSGQIQ